MNASTIAMVGGAVAGLGVGAWAATRPSQGDRTAYGYPSPDGSYTVMADGAKDGDVAYDAATNRTVADIGIAASAGVVMMGSVFFGSAMRKGMVAGAAAAAGAVAVDGVAALTGHRILPIVGVEQHHVGDFVQGHVSEADQHPYG